MFDLPTPTGPTPGLGPLRSGSNVMALGPPKQRPGTSLTWKAPPHRTGLVTPPTSIASTSHQREPQREREVWNVLQQQIHKAVADTAAHGKPFNGISSRTQVNQRVNDACNILRQIILGGNSQQGHYSVLSRKTTYAARQESQIMLAEPDIKEEEDGALALNN